MFALPAFNRRRLLLGLAAASVGAAVAPVAFSSEPLAAPENSALSILGDALPELTAEAAAADAAYWAIVREWEPRWPVAPDALVLHRYDERRLERGLRGWAINVDGDPAAITSGLQARCIETAADIRRQVQMLDDYMRRVRSKHPLSADDLAISADKRLQLVERLSVADGYEAARRDVLEQSGYAAADARCKAANDALAAHAGKIMAESPVTMAGVMIQAEALEAFGMLRLAPFEVSAWGWSRQFAANLLRIAREAPPEQA